MRVKTIFKMVSFRLNKNIIILAAQSSRAHDCKHIQHITHALHLKKYTLMWVFPLGVFTAGELPLVTCFSVLPMSYATVFHDSMKWERCCEECM